MVRLHLVAEGRTEQTFAGTLLKPHLANFSVYLQGASLVQHSKKPAKISRGGIFKYGQVKNHIRRLLKQEKGGDVFFTTMIDLYAIPADFPGLVDAENLRHMPQQRVSAIENAFAADIGDRRFLPYIQLHEYEAYLFSQPSEFEFFYDHHEQQIAALQAIADSHESPEVIDDGRHSAPSKRIIAQLPDYEGAKSTVGPQVAELIGLHVIRDKCPHFAGWLTRLESLGSSLQPPAETSND
jgi:hypothetical protein